MLVETVPLLLEICGWAAGKYSWLKLLKSYLSLYGGAEVAFSESLGSLAAVSKSCFVAGTGQKAKSAEGQFSALRLGLALLGELVPAV